jgi:hypothetical protein
MIFMLFSRYSNTIRLPPKREGISIEPSNRIQRKISMRESVLCLEERVMGIYRRDMRVTKYR